jgi:hypothetical protein
MSLRALTGYGFTFLLLPTDAYFWSQKFAPIVDYFEDAVTRFNGNEAGTSTSSIDTKYQYQRAYALSVNLRDELYVYSNEQLKQVQFQNALVYVRFVWAICRLIFEGI